MKNILLILIIILNFSCGVKGDPRPPDYPPELGRGRPAFKGATKGLKIQSEEEEEEDENEEEVEE